MEQNAQMRHKVLQLLLVLLLLLPSRGPLLELRDRHAQTPAGQMQTALHLEAART